jgi:hypothetical protein
MESLHFFHDLVLEINWGENQLGLSKEHQELGNPKGLPEILA